MGLRVSIENIMLKEVGKFLRWRDWGPGKLPVALSVMIYIGLSNGLLPDGYGKQCILLIIAAAVHCIFGYLVNEWGDRETDFLQGKKNVFRNSSRYVGWIVLPAILGIGLLSLHSFLALPMVLPLWLCWVFLSVAYSLTPLRLKGRGLAGLITSTAAQWTLPILLGFAVFGRFGGWDMTAIGAALSVSGAALEIGHQRHDRVGDQHTRLGTLGASLELASLNSLYRAVLWMDKVSVGVVILVLSAGLAPRFPSCGYAGPLWPLLLVYCAVFVPAFRESRKYVQRDGEEFADPYYSQTRSANKLLHETIPNFVVPAYLMALAVSVRHELAIVLLLFLVWRIVLGGADWRWPFKTVKAAVRRTLLK